MRTRALPLFYSELAARTELEPDGPGAVLILAMEEEGDELRRKQEHHTLLLIILIITPSTETNTSQQSHDRLKARPSNRSLIASPFDRHPTGIWGGGPPHKTSPPHWTIEILLKSRAPRIRQSLSSFVAFLARWNALRFPVVVPCAILCYAIQVYVMLLCSVLPHR